MEIVNSKWREENAIFFIYVLCVKNRIQEYNVQVLRRQPELVVTYLVVHRLFSLFVRNQRLQ